MPRSFLMNMIFPTTSEQENAKSIYLYTYKYKINYVSEYFIEK